jgi:hypothetical protein
MVGDELHCSRCFEEFTEELAQYLDRFRRAEHPSGRAIHGKEGGLMSQRLQFHARVPVETCSTCDTPLTLDKGTELPFFFVAFFFDLPTPGDLVHARPDHSPAYRN